MIPPILITGAPRSGTSMSAGVISLCGAWGGHMAPPNSNNKKGMFENIAIRDAVKSYLKRKGFDPMCQKPLPSDKFLESLSVADFVRWRERVLDVMEAQGMPIDAPWFYKDPKALNLWPLWVQGFPRAKWVIVRRDGDDIANSCMRTGFMRAYSTVDGWQEWVDTHLKRFAEMVASGIEYREIWPSKMIDGDFSEIQAVVEWLGLEWNEQRAKEFISPELWKGGK
jgi:hypothetical protein